MFSNLNGNPYKPYLFVISGAFMISFSAVFVKIANVGPSVSAFYRVFFGGIILAILTRIRGESFWKGVKSFKYAIFAALAFSLDLFLWHRSILYVGPGLATILGNLQVFFMAGFAFLFLKEKPTWKLLISIPLAVLGLFMIIGFDWSTASAGYHTGVILGFGTALSYAIYILLLRQSQRIPEKLSIYANLAIITLITAFLLGMEILIRGQESFAIPDLQTWGALVGLGLIIQVIGWILISKGLSEIEASVAGLLLLLQPALAFTWDILIFGRSATVVILTGAVLTLAAIYLGATGRRKKRVKTKKSLDL